MGSEKTVWLTAFGDLYVASRFNGHGLAATVRVNRDTKTEGVRMWEQSQRWCADDRWLWKAGDAVYRELSTALWQGLGCPWDMDLVVWSHVLTDTNHGHIRIWPVVVAESFLATTGRHFDQFNKDDLSTARLVAAEALASVPLVIP